MDRQKHPPSEFIQSRKHWNILCFFFFFFEYSCWNLFEFLFWSTVLMKWELFPRHWNPGKGGWENFVEQKNFVPPTLMRTAGFVRQEEWLEFFFFFFPSFDFILFSILAVVWYFKPLEAHRKYGFRWKKILFVSLLSPVPPKSSLCWWSFMHFCEL